MIELYPHVFFVSFCIHGVNFWMTGVIILVNRMVVARTYLRRSLTGLAGVSYADAAKQSCCIYQCREYHCHTSDKHL